MRYYGTLGPNLNKKADIKIARDLGVTGFRLNLAHSKLEERADWIENVKSVDQDLEIILDIEGRENRIDLDTDKFVRKDDKLKISSIMGLGIGVEHKFFQALDIGDKVSIDDGSMIFDCIEKRSDYAVLESRNDGLLRNKKSISIEGKKVDQDLLSYRDIVNLGIAKKFGLKSIMQPFVRSRDDIISLRKELGNFNMEKAKIYAKIEDQEGIDNIKEIIPQADEIVIARGDLGNNIGIINVAKIQKDLSKILREEKKDFMVVTQLLNSMIDSPNPTRAEVNDIYNSKLDGANSLMLTSETAIGKYPLEALKYLIEICKIGG